ncbi:MAG: type II toxin-antitoxin system VapC family toxin [Pyrinomonadaceae bacterium]
MSQPNNPGAVVIDANILISICSKEPAYKTAETALLDYATKGWPFYAPSAILTEVLFILCKKLQSGLLTDAEHKKAVESFDDYMKQISSSTRDNIFFILRAEEVRKGYSCLHSADGFYIALAEELARTQETELLTFDDRIVNQVKNNAPTVKVNLLTP